jgi:leucyl-tRNA synthetase
MESSGEIMNFREIEEKWQKKWDDSKIFEANPDSRKKYFLTFPIPYVNAYQHIGHLYTLMRVEAFARYLRMKGYNVLFPQGWHATGSPIVNASKRVKDREPKQIKIMNDMGIFEKDFVKFEKPDYWIEFFIPEFERDYKSIGMSIDWRREFITTSLNPHYNKFIEWQFRKLKERGYCIKGKFPVVWDPKENVAVGDHDRIEGEGEVPQEFYLFKFPLEDGRNIITATLRHDTIWGITNVYVNPDVEYINATVNGESWIIGQPIIEKLRNQEYNVEVKEKILGKEIIGKMVDSFGGNKVMVLPASFLDSNYGTGMVHSVPSDSADDLIALLDLQKNDKLLDKYNLNKEYVMSIKPIEIFDTPGVGGNSAQFFIDKYNVKNQKERDKLEKIKKELYKLTFTQSRFGQKYKEGFSVSLEGMSIPQGQEIIKKELLEKNKISIFYELTGKVIARSLTECVVKIVDNQWFLDYSNQEWKEKAKKCLNQIRLYPEKSRPQFEYVIDWLHEWACTREEGLGTRLPWDNKWLIESLSDSTIYMAYYTIAHKIKEMPLEEVDDSFFDYVFLGIGIGKDEWKSFREEFDYWYPLDFRNSGKDLIQNHLTFFMFNHVALFDEKYWPKGIGTNGWVTVDGRKMSKSLGNMIPVRDMVKQFGADISRLTILNGGEGMDDPNWETNFATSLRPKILGIHNFIIENYAKGIESKTDVDELFISRSNSLIKKINSFMDETMFRSSIQKVLFDYFKILKDYVSRTEGKFNKFLFIELSENFLKMISVFCPHIADEIWEKIGKQNFIGLDSWPNYDDSKINDTLEKNEDLLDQTVLDINNVVLLVKQKKGIDVKKVYLYVLQDELVNYSVGFLSKKVGKEVKVYAVNDDQKYDPSGKASKAKPGKPGLYVE